MTEKMMASIAVRREVNRQSMKKLVSGSHQADGLLLKDPKKCINRVAWYSKGSREAGVVCQQRSLALRKVSPNTAEPRKLREELSRELPLGGDEKHTTRRPK
mmetsp:Transcript_17220/g.57048  ORF Transcript_17220/g.57048 Transcript_17220/m.57048 type:complete len:102 (+) Transcript_17220:5602-5907(+)